MSPRLVILSVTLVLLLGPTLVKSLTYVEYLFEGTRSPTLLVDCTFSRSRDVGVKFGPEYGDFRLGTQITGYEVINLQTTNKARVARSSGGLGKDWMWFDMKTTNGNGMNFRFKAWGIVPAGLSYTVNDGVC